LKACENIAEDFEYQLINYLRSTTCEVGLLLNFGKEPQFSRKVFSNSNKKIRINPADQRHQRSIGSNYGEENK
jgi:hypothetical protein